MTARGSMQAAPVWQDATAHGLVILAGAGVSMGPPSSLPGWTDINDAFVENLALIVAKHTHGEVGYDVARFVLDRRDDAAVAQPDLQAQLAEESLSERYFGLFEPLDIETWNDGHAAIAAIAATGHLRAVVTTNFDRLIELAIEATGARASVYCDPEDFERLAAELEAGSASIPVIKVHGSIARKETMVDTLRQRVLGRPQALEAALGALFARHATLIVGFSGADLAYDPHYLGLRAGAAASPSFTVVNRQGEQPNAALAELVDSAGEHARIVDDVLPGCLAKLARELARDAGRKRRLATPAWDSEMDYPGIRRESLFSDVQQSLAGSISPVSATVVLASIARAAGSTDAAARLLTKTMPHHLRAGLKADPALPRQLGMIAETLIESCHIDDELAAGKFKGDMSASKVLSVDVPLDTESLALLALALSLVGEAPRSTAAAIRALRETRAQLPPTVRADTVWILARRQTLSERWDSSWLETVRQTYQMMFDWGDEPRRARLGAMLVRYLVETGQVEAAPAILVDCQHVVQRLGLAVTGNDLVAVAGRVFLAQGRHDDAVRALDSACRHAHAAQHNLSLAETLLPLAEAAAAAGNVNGATQSLAHFDTLLPLVPGMALPRAALDVRLLCSVGAFDEARGKVTELRSLYERWDFHPWIADLANRLEQRIDKLQPAATDHGP